MKEISDFAKLLGCSTVALHIGFVPPDRSSASYKGLLDVTRDLLDHVAANGQHIEHGLRRMGVTGVAAVDDRYLRARFRIPAGTNWSDGFGFQVKAKASGAT